MTTHDKKCMTSTLPDMACVDSFQKFFGEALYWHINGKKKKKKEKKKKKKKKKRKSVQKRE